MIYKTHTDCGIPYEEIDWTKAWHTSKASWTLIQLLRSLNIEFPTEAAIKLSESISYKRARIKR